MSAAVTDLNKVSGSNPMRKGAEKSKSADAGEEPPSKTALCSNCRLMSMATAFIVVIAIVIGVVFAMRTDEDDEATQVVPEAAAIAPEDLVADACPGEGATAAMSGQYTHFIQIVYSFEGETPNCTQADAINAATASATGASAEAMLVTIEEDSTARMLSLRSHKKQRYSGAWARALRRRGRVLQVILADSEEAAEELSGTVAEAASDGSLEEQINGAVP